jgi:hypothetical protein
MSSPHHEKLSDLTIPPDRQNKYQSLLWEKVEEISEIRADLQAQLERMFAEIQAKRASRLNLHEQDLVIEQETEYWKLNEQLLEIVAVEERIFKLLEGLEDGTVAEDKILPFLPEKTSEAVKEQQLSKRRRAIAKQQAKEKKFNSAGTYSFLGDVGLLYLFNGNSSLGGAGLSVGPSSDPRRISSGRKRGRVVTSSGQGVTELDFFNATADTHGGKTRSTGKSGTSYIGKHGRRIRKS